MSLSKFSFRWRQPPNLAIPTLIIGTPYIPGRIVGLCLGPVILIDSRYYEDEGTIIHELIHTRQFWRNGLVLHFLRYWFSESYRLTMELEAFRSELACRSEQEYGDCLDSAARILAGQYRLKISVDRIRTMLDSPGKHLV
jgi:hypothetical protein